MEIKMKHGSLFSGIGGIDLGFEMAGIETAWTCEVDDWCHELLKKRFPKANHYKDIRDVNKNNLESVDIISGGFPCQDISTAGKGAGLDGERSSLWFEMWRVICDLQPRWVFIENVSNLANKGGARVLHDLAKAGYDAEWQVISARDVGGRHLRKRLWIIAYKRELLDTIEQRFQGQLHGTQGKSGNKIRGKRFAKNTLQRRDFELSNTESSRRSRGSSKECRNEQDGKFQSKEQKGRKIRSKAERCNNVSTQPTSERRANKSVEKQNNGIGKFRIKTFEILKNESELDRVAYGLSQQVDRYNDRVQGLGNGVVPQIPYIIGRRIIKINNLLEE